MLIKSISVLVLLGAYFGLASAMPYYYFFQEDPNAAAAQAAASAGGQAQQPAATNEVAQNVKAAIESQQGPPGSPLQEKFVNHLSHFYEHGRKAMQGVYDNVSPDLKDIGTDLSEAAQLTGENVKTKVAPLKENVKPYIDRAQNAVAPYVGQAKEQVPKLIEQAGPVISKGFNELIGKIKTVSTPQGGPETPGVVKDAQKAVDSLNDKTTQLSTNNIQEATQDAAQNVANKVQPAS